MTRSRSAEDEEGAGGKAAPSRAQVFSVVLAVIEEFNAGQPERMRVGMLPGSAIFGAGGALDSIALVHLIVGVELRLEDAFGASVVLATEHALSRRHSPFSSVGSLAEYAHELLQRAPAAGPNGSP